MSLNFRAMLACSTIPDITEDVTYPVIASPKLDGIRCVMANGLAMSRTMKRIPNKFIQRALQQLQIHGLDGELMVDGEFEQVSSVIMSESHPDQHKFYYNVFDSFHNGTDPFKTRQASAKHIVQTLNNVHVKLVEQVWIRCADELMQYWDECVHHGYEGVIIRDPNGPYKQGRSTMNQGWMLKLKKFDDSEGLVIGFEELLHNDDTSSNKKENMIPGDTLGALEVFWNGKTFKVGSGFDTQQRDEIWQNREHYRDRHITFKHQGVTKYGIPRFPTFKGFRHTEDM